MRKGTNPGKIDYKLEAFRRHRVIIPVQIPERTGCSREAIEVLRLCLESLWRTTRGRVSVTVISNGSVSEVTALLHGFFDAGRIDQLVLNDHTWGTTAEALAAAHGRFEQLLTVADDNVLFLPGWVEEVERILVTFPEAGFVTPSPDPSLPPRYSSATILSAAVSRELAFEPVAPACDLAMVVRRDGVAACVGGGNRVFTLRQEVVGRIPLVPGTPAVDSGRTDDPLDAMGVWRLSTTRAYVRRMGNLTEPWMYEELETASEPHAADVVGNVELPPMTVRAVGMIPLRWRKLALAALRKSRYWTGPPRLPLARSPGSVGVR